MSDRQEFRQSALAIDVATTFLTLAIATLAVEIIHSAFGITRVSLVFLAAVTITASLRGTRAALLAAVAGTIFYKLFLDLRVGERSDLVEDVLTLAIFLVVALITGALAGKVRDEATTSQQRASRMEALFRASKDLSAADDTTFWHSLAKSVAEASGGPAFVLNRSGTLKCSIGEDSSNRCHAVEYGKNLLASPGEADRKSARWGAKRLRTLDGCAGVLIWERLQDDDEIDGSMKLLADIGSAWLERSRVQKEKVRASAAEEAAKLRDALLSSISHDFRSPLAAIVGSATSLIEYGDRFEQSVHLDLLQNINHEGEKLNQFVTNLLDLNQLQAGIVKPERKTLSTGTVIAGAIERLERHRGKKLGITKTGNCRVEGDPLLLEQVIYNVLDNAVKYGGDPSQIEVASMSKNGTCTIVMADSGPGLSQAERDMMFTRFHFPRGRGRSDSIGLGLSIAKGFTEAMGGKIAAQERSDGKPGLEVVVHLSEHR